MSMFYRSVSILTSLSKTFEKIMDNQMETLKKVFSDELSAFRNGYNTKLSFKASCRKMDKCPGPVQELWYTHH